MSDPILLISQIEKSFGRKKILHNVTLQVSKGEVFGFLGPNGAGKTTLIRIILGLVRPNHGEVIINGYNLRTSFKPAISRVGAVVETPKFFNHLSGYQNLLLVRNLHSTTPKSRIHDVLELTGLTKYADAKAGTYSLGMKQRLGIARALVNYPELIFLDEPMNGLDPQGMVEIRSLVNTLRHQGISFFITSHLLHEVEQVCDHIAIIKAGIIVTQGRLAELLFSDSETVEIHTDQLQKAYEALDCVAFIKSRAIMQGYLVAEIDKGSSGQLNRLLVNRNIHVNYLIPKKHSLEDFFMERTHGGKMT